LLRLIRLRARLEKAAIHKPKGIAAMLRLAQRAAMRRLQPLQRQAAFPEADIQPERVNDPAEDKQI